MERIKEWLWFIKNIILTIIYAIVSLPLYHIIAELSIELSTPHTLFTPIDWMIPFIGYFSIFYVFLFYPFILFTFGYFAFVKPEKFNKYYVALMLIYAISYIIYLIFPVMMIRPKPEELPKDFFSQVMAKYYESDPPYNCFPSLHAATSTLTAYWLSKEEKTKKYKWLWWFIAIMVMISTLFVRQHVIADEIAGFLVAYFCSCFADRKIKEGKPFEKYFIPRVIFTIILASLVTIFIISGYIP